MAAKKTEFVHSGGLAAGDPNSPGKFLSQRVLVLGLGGRTLAVSLAVLRGKQPGIRATALREHGFSK